MNKKTKILCVLMIIIIFNLVAFYAYADKSEDKIIEEREPEPLVVTGKVEMPVTAGDSLEQGLKTTLEKVIDFTDPNDPHPWFETDAKGPFAVNFYWDKRYYHEIKKPLVVERNGLKYRVTRPVSRAY